MASTASSAADRPAIGIISIGDMGMGIAKLLLEVSYPVYTVDAGRRSQHTKDRIKAANITAVSSDQALVVECDIIFSIVPPRDAVTVAKRISDACKQVPQERRKRKGSLGLLYIDMNAISPKNTKLIQAIFAGEPSTPSVVRRLSRSLSMGTTSDEPPVPILVGYLDGAIIGGPPAKQPDKTWKRPSIVLSGPEHELLSDELMEALNVKLISDKIGSASTLKACFAGINKGLIAVGILAYTTAHTAGVLPELQEHLQEFYPTTKDQIEKGLTMMPPKAYRWVDEMRQIGDTFTEEGKFSTSEVLFGGVAELYKLIAEDSVLGREKTGKRKRGTTAEDVAEAIRADLMAKREKKEEKLEVAWKSSWT